MIKDDISVNYLSEDEIDSLNRLTVIFLETAELRAKNREDLTVKFWKENVNKMLEFNDMKILSGGGSISKGQMENKVREIYSEFDTKRKEFNAKLADENDLKNIENEIKNSKKK